MCCINTCYFKSFLSKSFLDLVFQLISVLDSSYTSCFFVIVEMLFICLGEDIWRYVGKLTDAQKSMLDDRFKWKVSVCFCFYMFSFLPFQRNMLCQVREMEKRREGQPGEARAALKRSVRENG